LAALPREARPSLIIKGFPNLIVADGVLDYGRARWKRGDCRQYELANKHLKNLIAASTERSFATLTFSGIFLHQLKPAIFQYYSDKLVDGELSSCVFKQMF
jgi:hypothetical protein